MVARPLREGLASELRFRDSVTVCIPAVNNALSLPRLIERTVEALQSRVTDYEIIVVDDGNADETRAVLSHLQRAYAPFLRVITHRHSLGHGAALRTAFHAATKTHILYADGKAHYDPRDLALVLDGPQNDSRLRETGCGFHLVRRSELISERHSLSRLGAVYAVLAIVCLSVLAYARALSLPFIADDYLQIHLGRDYGPVERWPALAQDALYRCRATSIVLTHWLERAVGVEPFYYNLTSLLLHAANSLLVFALGFWKPLGWRISALAACYFAISQRHSEAVIWFAALPELLVFLFVLAGFGLWVAWLQSGRPRPALYAAALVAYALALLSKESAIALVPLCALAVLVARQSILRRLLALSPFAAIGVGYFVLGWLARATHLHFNDGTFSLQAPVVEVITRSTLGLLWVWGMVALLLAAARFIHIRAGIIKLSLAWIVLALIPYSFLTYMPRVPSRHTYLASVGLAWLVASALIALRSSRPALRRRWLVPAAACAILLHECGYIWTVLHHRYILRARPTELVLEQVRQTSSDIYANCFPYGPITADLAIAIAAPGRDVRFSVGPAAARHPKARDFCNAVTEGKRY